MCYILAVQQLCLSSEFLFTICVKTTLVHCAIFNINDNGYEYIENISRTAIVRF